MSWIHTIEKDLGYTIQHALSEDGEFKIPNTKYKADGYDPKTETVYEFHGTIFHSHPKYFEPNS